MVNMSIPFSKDDTFLLFEGIAQRVKTWTVIKIFKEGILQVIFHGKSVNN